MTMQKLATPIRVKPKRLERSLERGMSFLQKLGIPLVWLIIAIAFDIMLFARIGWSFPVSYFFSLVVMVIWALVISCIPSRVAQIVIFSITLCLQIIVVMSNVGAQFNLGEIFSLENLTSIRGIIATASSATVAVWVETGVAVSLMALFWTSTIIMARRFRKIRAGYTLKGITTTYFVIILALGGALFNFMLFPRESYSVFANGNNPRFQFNTFENRHNFLRAFGPAMFYTRNIMALMGGDVLGGGTEVLDNFEYSVSDNQLSQAILNDIDTDEDGWLLDEDNNLIMILMETVEGAAINPFLSPNLWSVKMKSTSVDGFYSTERTCMTEYVSLVGSHVRGVEMWNSFPNTFVPQSLPHIFRRSWQEEENQIAFFHNHDIDIAYNRPDWFGEDYLGFDFIADPDDYGIVVDRRWEANSDRIMFEAMVETMAPSDRAFFSYILTIGPHAPHFGGAQVTRVGHANPNTGNLLPSGQRVNVYDVGNIIPGAREGVYPWKLQALPHNREDLQWVLDNEELLSFFYPRIRAVNENGTINNEIRRAVISYLVMLRDLDRGIGVLLNHLETTPDLRRDESGNTMLIDTTALVLFSDHFNFVAYNNADNTIGGGLLSALDQGPRLVGERLSFMIYNPHDTRLRNRANGEAWKNLNWDEVDLNYIDWNCTQNAASLYHGNSPLPFTGRMITRFMANTDIYATVAHLFGIQTSSRFTLGVSVLDDRTHSLGVGFMTNVFFGKSFSTGQAFLTEDFTRFYSERIRLGNRWVRITSPPPCTKTITYLLERACKSSFAMFDLRLVYSENGFASIPESFYAIGSARVQKMV